MDNLTAPLPRLLRWLTARWRDDRQWVSVLTWNIIARYWSVMAIAFMVTLLAGLFEGSTMAVLVLAINVLVGSTPPSLTAALGPLTRWFGPLLAVASKETVFLVLLLAAIVFQVLRSLAQFTNTTMLARLHGGAECSTATALFRQLLRLSYGQITRHKAGDLASYASQARAPGMIVQALNDAAVQVVLGLSLVGILCWVSWPMTLAVLAAILLLSWPLRGLQRRIRQASRERDHHYISMMEATVEYLQGLRLLHTFNRQDYACMRYEHAVQQEAAALRRNQILHGLLTPVLECLAILGVGVFLLLGILILGQTQQDVLSCMLSFLFVLYRLLPRVVALHNAMGQINIHFPAMHRIASLLRTDDKQFRPQGGPPAPKSFQVLEFRNVGFRYQGTTRAAVTGISFLVPRGTMIALVGESGAGKSTLSDLLLRLYDPTEGAILLDGTDLRAIDPDAWRDRLGVVSQDGFLFHTTVADNIRFGRPEATETDVVAAAELAGAAGFVCEMPHGFATTVGDRGHQLSGGQRQQLAIARALVREPQILLLDEATSSLDNQSERLIQQAIERLGGTRTIVVIAHRLSTIIRADQIIVLQRGQIVERGTHPQLLVQNGYYARLWRLQTLRDDAPAVDEPLLSPQVDAA